MPAPRGTGASLVIELQRAAHAVGVRVEAELRDLGVSQGEAHVLALLAEGGEHTVGELQRGLRHRPSTLTGILDRLENRAWITRTLNDADRRSLLVTLTRQGRRAAGRVTAALRRIEEEAIQAAGAAGVRGFGAVARALSGDPG
ncbi:MAG TPA: MarR family transcriptional regulator [Candidatus Dormibacteraeota bacterium]|nr:MarR family transcriptional regulator [Candidatus Dormibacteraeota bacterium]